MIEGYCGTATLKTTYTSLSNAACDHYFITCLYHKLILGRRQFICVKPCISSVIPRRKSYYSWTAPGTGRKPDLHRSACLGPPTYPDTPPVYEASQPNAPQASIPCQGPLHPALLDFVNTEGAGRYCTLKNRTNSSSYALPLPVIIRFSEKRMITGVDGRRLGGDVQMWMGCKSCRPETYSMYDGGRKARQTAADGRSRTRRWPIRE
jgi:hypothetical protein